MPELTDDMAVLLVVLTPFLAAVLAPAIWQALRSWTGWALALVPATGFAFLWGMTAAVAEGRAVAVSVDWGLAHGLRLSFLIDGLSLAFSLAITGIGTLILIYSGAYLKGHPHQGRFFAFIMLFMGAMLGLVLADSGVVLYAFWELTTLASFLLIGFDHMRQAARRAAIQAMIITSAGGLALLVAAVLLQRLAGAWELSALHASVADLAAHPAYGPITILVLFAAFTKSAQVPFHFWLPNAMEAPTPVSAFLHSATMVQGGVYLLMRLSPALGGTSLWTGALVLFGALTLLWGAVGAVRETDMKQMLAQTTIASLGLLVLLVGIGSETAIVAAVVYFLAHALYKAGLFLVVGIIDHEAGTRDITALGGLRQRLALTFAAAVLAGASMLSLPPFLGYLAKEEMYRGLAVPEWTAVAIIGALVVGNGLVGAVALAIGLKPFTGPYVEPPKNPHEAPFAMLAGPLALGGLGLFLAFTTDWLAAALLAPASSAIMGVPSHAGLHWGIDARSLVFWLSVLTWILGALAFWRFDRVRTLLRRGGAAIWSADRVFDVAMFGLIRFSAAMTRTLHHGRLELYLALVFALLAVALIVPLWSLGGLPQWPILPQLHFYEWGVMGLAVIGVVAVLLARTRLFAILALGIQGLAVSLIYLLFGAPDLSFTQFMVEVLSVIILALVMTRLHLDKRDSRELEDLLRDGSIALACGVGVTLFLFAVLEGVFEPRLSEFFNAASVELAHGRNVVNVILVDFRGLDTLGEISVIMTAGIAILALIRGARKGAA